MGLKVSGTGKLGYAGLLVFEHRFVGFWFYAGRLAVMLENLYSQAVLQVCYNCRFLFVCLQACGSLFLFLF